MSKVTTELKNILNVCEMKIIKYKVESNDFGKIKAIFLDCISKYIN